jgi:alginate O-acetyltransferase complex protein AlgJ
VLSADQKTFWSDLAREVAALEKKNAGAVRGADGWLFLTSELRFLAQGRFWGEPAGKTSRAHKAEWADPIPAIVDFHRQLRERGIELLLVPVPPKAAIYPEKLGFQHAVGPNDSAPFLQEFYADLRGRGIDVLDLTTLFARNREDARGPLYCQTDSHWSGLGCVLASEAIAQAVRGKFPAADGSHRSYETHWKDATITGDLVALLPAGVAKPDPERLAVRTVSETPNGYPVQPDANSPVLVMGDSHTLVFHEFLSERAGLVDQLAKDLGFAPDLIGTRGSGATAVRVSLYRRTRTDPGYLARKKVIVWCFAAREFTEADQGWVLQPVAK